MEKILLYIFAIILVLVVTPLMLVASFYTVFNKDIPLFWDNAMKKINGR